MPGRRARVIAPSALNRVQRYVSHHADPARSRVMEDDAALCSTIPDD
jgi:hypothetical protein